MKRERRPGQAARPHLVNTNNWDYSATAPSAPLSEQILLLPPRCTGCGEPYDRCRCDDLDALALELYRLFGGEPS